MNKINPLVSIIMNCHNGERYLEESLNCVLNQTYQNWELIFFDNNSYDNSKKILSNYENDQRVKYFKSNKLLKLYDARNKAIEQAKGKYIAFIDTDDLWTNNKLEKQIIFFENNQDFEIIYSNYNVRFENEKIEILKYKKELPSGNAMRDFLKEYSIGILTVMMKRKIFELQNFNGNYDIIGDFDLFIRLSKNYKIGCIQEPLSTFRYHDQNLSKKKIKSYIIEYIHWIKINRKTLCSGHNLINIRITIFKLILKYVFHNFIKFLRFKNLGM